MRDEEKIKRCGRFVRQLRQEAGLAPKQLSRRLGKVPTYIEDIESAELIIDLEDFLTLVQTLGLDPTTTFARLVAFERDG